MEEKVLLVGNKVIIQTSMAAVGTCKQDKVDSTDMEDNQAGIAKEEDLNYYSKKVEVEIVFVQESREMTVKMKKVAFKVVNTFTIKIVGNFIAI